MARYIDADKTIELLKSLGSRDYRREKGTICDAIKMLQYPEYTPTADVVPKSEVEKQKLEIWRLQGEVERLQRYNTDVAFKHYADGKKEAATAIFEDIENTLNKLRKQKYTITVSTVESIDRIKAAASESALRAFRDYIAELKKSVE